MEYNLSNNLQYCYQFFVDAKGLLYYTHIPAIIVSLFFGSYVLLKRRDQASVLLAIMAVVFSIYSTIDLLQWVYIGNNTFLMSSWAELGLLSALLFFITSWFVHISITERPLPAWMAAVWLVALLPIFIFTPTTANLAGYDIRDCIAIEGAWFTNYYYGLGILAMALMAVSAYQGLRKKSAADDQTRAARSVVFAGAELFALSFLITGAVASYLVDQEYIPDFGLAQYGMVAMTLFVGVLAYATVRYRAFNIKLISSQALVAALVLLVAAEFLFITNPANYALVGVTLFLTLVFGWFLVRSVKREIAQREELAIANQGQENLIHIMNHQIKGYLATARNIFAELLEGADYGAMPEASKPLLAKGLEEMGDGVEYVQGILKGNSAHSGAVQYDFKPMDLRVLVAEFSNKQKEVAEKAGLSFKSTISEGDYTITGDAALLEEAFKNLITNAIKYNNPNGSVAVALSRIDKKILFSVKDTGIGISKDDAPNMFKPGGMGKDAIKHNVESSGFGLALVKPVVEKHQGRVWYASNSPEQGTTFFVELPAK